MFEPAVKAIVVGEAQLKCIAACWCFAEGACACVPDTGESIQPALRGAGWCSNNRYGEGFTIDGVFRKLNGSKISWMIREVVIAGGIKHIRNPGDCVIRGCNLPAHRDFIEDRAWLLFFALDVHQGCGAGDKRMVFRNRRMEEAKAFGFRLDGVLNRNGFTGFRCDVPRCWHRMCDRQWGVSLRCADIGDVSRRVKEDVPARAPLGYANVQCSCCIGCKGHRDRQLRGCRFGDGNGVSHGWHCRCDG